MKKKLIIALSLAFVLIMTLGTAVAAFAPYETYTYSISGDPMPSPAAYEVPDGGVHTAVTMSQYGKVQFTTVAEADGYDSAFEDLCTDSRGWVYISDKKKNRVIALNQNFKAQYIISDFVSDLGPNDTLSGPRGLFATDKYLYVCDTGNSRIVVFNTSDGSYHKNIAAPSSRVFREGYVFSPIAVAVDKFGKLFVVSETTTEGVIVMDENSVFTGYIGAQKVVVSAFDQFFRRFKSKEDREEDIQNIATNLRNIALEHGEYGDFMYVVSDSVDETEQANAIDSKKADYSPVRKLNNKGDEIMKRNGFFDCGGEVNVKESALVDGGTVGVSKIIDVAAGPPNAGTWSIIDRVRRKVYTYDRSGQLLFVFGDTSGEDSTQIGQIGSVGAIDYQYDREKDTYNILLLDTNNNNITCFVCTDYGEQLLGAIESDNNLDYEESAKRWKEILESNNNFDAAYIGYGKALYNKGDYEGALKYLAAAKETEIYSETLKAQSQERISSNIMVPILIVVAVVVLIVLVVKFFGYSKRINYAGNFKKKHTFWEEIMYAFYVMFHPFDGFWDIKHEGRGTVRGALAILGVNILAFYYQNIGRSYLANPTGQYSAFWTQIAAVTVPVLLWAVANWCLTTLFDGEAKFKHVFVASCYALAPLPAFVIAGTIITNLSNTVGDGIVTLVTAIGYVWVAYLLFFGTLVVQDYSLGKNVITTIGTILCMAVIMFVVILFASLVGDMVGFVSNLITEISYRT